MYNTICKLRTFFFFFFFRFLLPIIDYNLNSNLFNFVMNVRFKQIWQQTFNTGDSRLSGGLVEYLEVLMVNWMWQVCARNGCSFL